MANSLSAPTTSLYEGVNIAQTKTCVGAQITKFLLHTAQLLHAPAGHQAAVSQLESYPSVDYRTATNPGGKRKPHRSVALECYAPLLNASQAAGWSLLVY